MSTRRALLVQVLVLAACALVYELLAATIASYLLGDAVTQYSIVLGLYLSALGVGAALTKRMEHDLARRFVQIELALAIVGGLSAPMLFGAFALGAVFRVVLYVEVFAVGALVGVELPLLMRLLRDELDTRELAARAIAFDHAGALVASLLFPWVLVPLLGVARTSIVCGAINVVVALWGSVLLRSKIGARVVGLRVAAAVVGVVLGGAFVGAERIAALAE